MRRILFAVCLMTGVLGLWGCGMGDGTGEAGRQQDTQTTEVISGSAVESVTSDNIPVEKYLTQTTRERDAELEKELKSKKYTWKDPLVAVNPYGNSPLSAYIIFYTKEPCGVAFSVGEGAKEISGKVEKATYHRVPVLGLSAGKKNQVSLKLLGDDGKVTDQKSISIKTKELPEKLKNAVNVEKGGQKSAYGLTIVSGQTTKYPFAYDAGGEIRWYLTMTTGSYGVFPLSGGRLIHQTDEALTPTEEKPHTTSMYELDYMGRVYQLYYVKNGIHHEVIEKTPGGNLLTLSSSIDGHTEDVVLELDRETGEIVKSLDMRDVFDDTYENKVDWVHLNTVSYKQEDNTVLLSPRNLHSAVKVDWDTNEIRWIITNPEMFAGTEQEKQVLKPQGDITWHFQPHSIYEISKDLDGDPDTVHIMLYDNHWQTKRKVDFFDGKEQSYVSVYTVNEKEGTVRQDKLFAGVRSIITSNCAYEEKAGRMFSFGGYLYPLVGGRKGMIYEFDYKTGTVENQYSTKEYFYRGYEMAIDWDDLAQPMSGDDVSVKGTLQAPIVTDDTEMPEEALPDKWNGKADFVLRGNVLYMNTSDHAVRKLRFLGEKKSYIMDYSSAGKGMKSKAKQTYAIAIPLTGLEPDTYRIVVEMEKKWYDTGKSFVRENPDSMMKGKRQQ